ncbi:MAG: hypothetical protein V2I56_17855 [Desulfobacteraceae bacterium]|jgi:hypothetical protein|nr:hypothetical protein [Desulfobacteraceae bacterium]
MDKLFELISHMAPEQALSEITKILGSLLQDLDSAARERFLMTLIGQSEGDKASGMVHL